MRSFTAWSVTVLGVGLILAACAKTDNDPQPSDSDAAASDSQTVEGTDVGADSSSSDASAGMTADASPDGALQAPNDDGSVDADGFDGNVDAGTDAEPQDSGDSGITVCAVSGAPGECIEVSACTALADHTAVPGHCPGPADIQCCITTPSTTDNPPTPAGYRLMTQSEVTPQMTTWAVAILNDPTTYPMFSTTTMVFGTLTVLARVEWHPPDFQNGVIHRGVTLYVPI